MSELITRAEQGLLGAMLRDYDHPFVVDSIEPDDFAHAQHRAVYRALLENDTSDASPEQRIALVTAVAETNVDPAWLRELVDNAPPDALVIGYSRIVYEASFNRMFVDLAEPAHRAADAVTDPEGRAELRRLAEVLDAQVAYFGAQSTSDPIVDIAPTVKDAELDLRIALTREDQVIADIVQHPERARDVAAWLDSAVFTTEQRRHTFEFAVSQAYDSDHFDAVTLAWQINRAQNITAYPNAAAPPASIDADYTYLTRLYTATVTSGAAVVVGRELLTAHVQAQHQHAARPQQVTPIGQTPPRPQQQQLRTSPPLHQAPATDIRPIEL